MNKLLKLSLILLLLLPSAVNSQNNRESKRSDKNTQKKNADRTNENKQNVLPQNNSKNISGTSGDIKKPDYKIISSNSKYIEIEYYPEFQPRQIIKYNNQSFDYITFDNAGIKNSSSFGQPVLQSRNFPIFVPSEDKNIISVIDYDESDVSGINMAPVPNFHYKDPSKHNFENIELVYKKDPSSYSQNKFFPENIAELSDPHSVRDNVMSNIILNPYRYNPATGVLKQYTRIRVRITFTREPVTIGRPKTFAELELLRNAAINSDIGINWRNPKSYHKDVPVINSVMSTGDWYRIEIKDNGSGGSDGMYKINKNFLENAGINLTNVDPRTIKIYGNGGEILDTSLIDPRPVDLTQIAIYIYGQEDGHFDAGDYILFYGSGVNNWVYDTSNASFNHKINFYSGSNYYWICFNTSGTGKRMQPYQSENDPNAVIRSSYTEKIFFEPEITNPLNEGNVWLSEKRSNGDSFLWNNTLTGLETGSNILYKIKPASRVITGYENHMYISEDNSTVSPNYFQMYTVGLDYGDWIWTGKYSFTINTSQKTNGEQSAFRAAFYTNEPGGEGYIDWMEIQYRRRLNSVTGDFIRVVDTASPGANRPIEYNISSFTSNSVKVFDARDHANLQIITPLPSGSGTVRFQKTPQTLISKYFVVGDNGYKTPTSISGKSANQNLHGISDGADFIIISYSDFIPAANRLKAKREGVGPNNPSYLKTMVVDVQQIYNEFSGGLLDPTAIRDFLKYAYFNWQRKPAYVCLVGDGGVDYRNIEGVGGNYVPAFEFSDPNINQVANFCSDDFFVHLTGEGIFPLTPDIACGRIPANRLEDANNYIDKLDCYEDGNYNGYWKNKVILVADDGWTDGGHDGTIHTDQSERLATGFIPETFEQIKIYLIKYPPVITPAGRRKPDANKDLIKYWNDGSICVDWVGHGSPDLWAHEYVFEKEVTISQLNNVCKYPFVTVASCDFGKFDNPLSVSGAELLMISAKKGSIGTLSATRPTYSGSNETFMNTFYNHLFYQRDTLLLQNRFGQACFQTKLQLHDQNSLKYVLLCDPTLRDQYPRFISRIDSMVGLSYDTMRALSKIKVYGSIMHPDSTLWGDYNGKIFMKIFDATKHISIVDEFSDTFNFVDNGGIIFSGTQYVKNGSWLIEFVVPKDLSYQDQNGKLINYFYNNSFDGSSIYKNFIVGGINPDAAIDTTGPKINLYLNNINFRSGDIVNENFTLLADLFDESGINTTGTIGHKIEATLNDEINNRYDLTSYYNSDTTYKSGHISYPFSGMAQGKYNLKLKAWDTYDNSSEASIDFTVSYTSSLQVMNVYNYPNPFKDKTVFTFQHNYPNSINVKIKIYTVTGRLIKVITQANIPDKFVSIDWNGADQDGDKISNGVYIYKLTVETTDGANSVINTGKLAVLK